MPYLLLTAKIGEGPKKNFPSVLKNKSGYNARQKVSRHPAWGLVTANRIPIGAFGFRDTRKHTERGSGGPALDLSMKTPQHDIPQSIPPMASRHPGKPDFPPHILPKIPIQMQALYPPYFPIGTPTRTSRCNTILASTPLVSRHLDGSCSLACLATNIPTLIQSTVILLIPMLVSRC